MKEFKVCIVFLSIVTLLPGCVLDGFTISKQYRPTHPDVGEPVANGATWRLAPTSELPVTIYLRVFRVAPNAYVMEKFVDQGASEPPMVLITTARFIPLGDSWHALHWQQKDGEAQGYHIVRLGPGASPSMLILDVSGNAAKQTIQAAQSMEGLKLEENKFSQGLNIADANANEQQVLRFLKNLVAKGGQKGSMLLAVGNVPSALSGSAYARVGALFSQIDQRDFVDRNRGAQIAAYFQALHDLGNGWGSYGLARLFNNGWGVAKDLRQTRELAHVAIARGVPQANNLLGIFAYFGIEEPENPARAIAYFHQAANAGEARAYAMLGTAYLEGKGVVKDEAKAKVWFEKAQPHLSYAKVELARLLFAENQPASDALAIAKLDEAIAEDDTSAYNLRGVMHARGRGGAVDQAAASAMFIAAAQRGDPDSQWAAGERLLRGIGIAVDRAKGEQWIRAAADAGMPQARRSLTRLEAKPAPSTSAPADAATASALVNDAYFKDMQNFVDEMIERKRAEVESGKRAIALLDTRAVEIEAEQAAVRRQLRALTIQLRATSALELALLAENRQLVSLNFRKMVLLDEIARQKDVRQDQVDTRARLAQARAKVSALEAKEPGTLALRLPNGQAVVSRPDGVQIALQLDNTSAVDASRLPGEGDQRLNTADVGALLEYEQAWAGVEPDRPRVRSLVQSLNELIGPYACDQRVAGRLISKRNSAARAPGLAADIGGVLRFREQLGNSHENWWHEKEEFVPMTRVGAVEVVPAKNGGCSTVHLRCDSATPRCVMIASQRPEIETTVATSLSFTSTARAREAAGIVHELVDLHRARPR